MDHLDMEKGLILIPQKVDHSNTEEVHLLIKNIHHHEITGKIQSSTG